MNSSRDLSVCVEVVNLLPAYAAEELSSGDRTAVRDHLRGCSACCEEHRASVELAPAMRASLVPPEPSEGFARGVGCRLPRQECEEPPEKREPDAS